MIAQQLTLGCREGILAVVIAVALIVVGAWSVWRAVFRIKRGAAEIRANERVTKGYCPQCGYDLAGRVGDKCAECGYRFNDAERRRLANIAEVLLRSRR